MSKKNHHQWVCERPILFSTPMIRAIMHTGPSAKTQTRRTMKNQPAGQSIGPVSVRQVDDGFQWFGQAGESSVFKCPYGKPGDHLWVKERHAIWHRPAVEHDGLKYPAESGVYYFADQGAMLQVPQSRWRPSIHMHRINSRITLRLENVRAEPLQDISERDAIAEGVRATGKLCVFVDPILEYRFLWNKINMEPTPIIREGEISHYESYPWSAEDFDDQYPGVRESRTYRGKPIFVTPNPWVWVVDFKRIKP